MGSYNNFNITKKLNVFQDLNENEKKMFSGLDSISKKGGRIYKTKSSDGQVSFFQAKGFFSSIYNFLFSKRLNASDFSSINEKIIDYIDKNNSNNPLKVKVEGAFLKVFQKIAHLDSFRAQPFAEGSPHKTIIDSLLNKIEARNKEPSFTGQKDEVLSQEEIALLFEWIKTKEKLGEKFNFASSSLHSTVNNILKAGSPVANALGQMQKIAGYFAAADVKALKEKAANGKLSEAELSGIVEAKRLRVELQNSAGAYLNLESFNKSIQGLDQLFQLSILMSDQINVALLDHYSNEHRVNAKVAKSPQSVLVEGAGPNGLMTAFKLYMAGANVSIVNSREELYTRGQILRLDPKWVSELQFYLGKEFNQMVYEGWAVLKPSGYVEVPTNILEDAIKGRMAILWSKEDADGNKEALDIQYELEMKGIVSKDEGRFEAELVSVDPKSKKVRSEVIRPFDAMIFVGGANDRLRDKYLCPPIKETSSRDYTVSVFKRESPDLNIVKYAGKEDFRGTFETYIPFNEIFSRAIFDSDTQDIENEDLNHLIEESQYINSEDIKMDYRFFENPHQLYLGLQYSENLSKFFQKIFDAKAKAPKEKAASYDALINGIEKQLQTLVLKKLGVEIDSKINKNGEIVPAFKKQSTSRFPVALSKAALPSKTMESQDGHKAFISVLGDALATPHFFSGSGLSSGREGVNNLVNAMREILKGEPLEEVSKSLNNKQESVGNFALQRGKAFTPLLRSDEIEFNRRQALKKTFFNDVDNKLFPGTLLVGDRDRDPFIGLLTVEGKSISIEITDKGIEYNGDVYLTLSEIRSAIQRYNKIIDEMEFIYNQFPEYSIDIYYKRSFVTIKYRNVRYDFSVDSKKLIEYNGKVYDSLLEAVKSTKLKDFLI